ncbi:MAG TPA: cupin domain-containing protein [Candidatus Binataceae bacterium]|nr:cupin domain-containing protein [Candidatus Binataceae bacterium]
MADASALTRILVALAHSSDLKSQRVKKDDLPPDVVAAVTRWTAIGNAKMGKPAAALDAIADSALRSKYSDDEREFYTLEYSRAAGSVIKGWLIVQGGVVVGDVSDEPNSGSPSKDFLTARLPVKPSAIAPDGTDVRMLLQLNSGSLAHFELAPGKISHAVTHRTIEEIWYFLGGQGEMWRKQGDREQIVPIEAGVCTTIPSGTKFQFRSYGYAPLVVVVITIPPWPGGDEAYEVDGKWKPTVG